MKVAIIGSRTVPSSYYSELCDIMPVGTSEIISGGASGADELAQKYACEMGLPIKIYRPDYAKYGKQAAIVRNLQIIRSADYVIALWDGASRGTSNTIKTCVKEYIPIRVIDCSKQDL